MTGSARQHHIVPLRTYLTVGLTLVGLTIVTVWVAQYDLGAVNLVVAMIIAVTKGTLVAMVFMHLKYTNKLYALIFVGAILFLAVFIVFTMFDTMARDEVYAIKSGPIDDRAIIYQIDSASTAAALPDSSIVDTDH